MTQTLPVLLIFLNIVVSVFLVVLFVNLKRYEKNVSSYYSKEGKKTIEDAKKQAEKIVHNTQIFTDDLKSDIQQTIKQSVQDTKSSVDNFYKSVTDEQNTKLKEALIEISNYYKESSASLQDEIKKTTIAKQKETEELINSKMQQTLNEIDQYKKDKLANFDKQVQQFVQDELKTRLPSYVDIDDQEKMVIEIVEKAQKQGFFTVWLQQNSKL